MINGLLSSFYIIFYLGPDSWAELSQQLDKHRRLSLSPWEIRSPAAAVGRVGGPDPLVWRVTQLLREVTVWALVENQTHRNQSKTCWIRIKTRAFDI